MKRLLIFAGAALALFSCSPKSPSIDAQVEDILSKMTLEEKVKIIHAQSKFSSAGVPRLGIPELWTDDGPHGVRPEVFWDQWNAAGWTNDSCTAFPALTCLAATWDRGLAAMYGKSIGEEARYRRKNVLLGPGVNILRTPLNGRNFEYFGEDPFLSGQMCVPYIKGVQSNGTAVCVKHYCLNNQEFQRHNINVNVDDRTLYEIYLPAFKAAVQEGGAWSVMGAYVKHKDQYASHNEVLVNKILKGEWGFDGVLISDWGACEDTDEAVKNGLDIEMGSNVWGGGPLPYDSYYLANPYLEGIKSGKYGTEELDDKCRRVLKLMLRSSMYTPNTGRFTCPEHSAAARKIGSEGIVLLKNEGGLLPLKSDARRIVVLGENAIKPMTIGGGSSSLKAKYEVSILDGIRTAFPGTEVVYERAYQGSPTGGSDAYGKYDLTDGRSASQMLADALAAVTDADYVIFVGGLNKDNFQDSEGADRLDMDLPYNQNEVISAIAAVRPDLVVVNVSGNPVSMPWADSVAAIVQDWYIGSEAGNSLADVLSGAVCPSGKLPFSIPVNLSDGPLRSERQYPGVRRADGVWEQDYSEGIYVGYRWFEAQGIKPRYAFGYGLSYTQFEYGEAKASSKKMGKSLRIRVPVKNVGKVAGAEIVQLYISDTESSVDRPVKELKGFDKVWLEPGESAVVEFTIGRDALSFFDAGRHEWVAEPGEFTALVGAASDDIRTSVKFNL